MLMTTKFHAMNNGERTIHLAHPEKSTSSWLLMFTWHSRAHFYEGKISYCCEYSPEPVLFTSWALGYFYVKGYLKVEEYILSICTENVNKSFAFILTTDLINIIDLLVESYLQ